jgi:hypothetical protein
MKPPPRISGHSRARLPESLHIGAYPHAFPDRSRLRCRYLFKMALHSSPIKSNDVRLPEPQPGEALVVERYSAEHVKAVILHPDDFAELQGSSELLDDLTVTPELSHLGVRAHQIAESPEGELIDDEASVRRLLGL